MTLFLVALILIAVLGYLAQTTGLCMVRGTKELLNGKPAFLLAILLCGVWAWAASLSSDYFGVPMPLKIFEANGWFALGGVLFGLGAAFNQGCGVSTLSQFSRGKLQMSATLVGWVVGWSILAYWRPARDLVSLPPPSLELNGILVVLSVGISIWALVGDPARRKLWLGMMGIGLLAGFLFLCEPGWTPSAVLHDLTGAILQREEESWPSFSRYVLLVALLDGMNVAAARSKLFSLRSPNWKIWLLHLLAGTLMGIGASLAMGGNDSQLLLTLPAFSPAGFLAVACMVVGIIAGLRIYGRLGLAE